MKPNPEDAQVSAEKSPVIQGLSYVFYYGLEVNSFVPEGSPLVENKQVVMDQKPKKTQPRGMSTGKRDCLGGEACSGSGRATRRRDWRRTWMRKEEDDEDLKRGERMSMPMKLAEEHEQVVYATSVTEPVIDVHTYSGR